MQEHPHISVLIITWNSKPFLPTCLDKLAKQSFPGFEVFVVDNGSIDSSVDDLAHKYPDLTVRVERLKSNFGFAAANNIGARLARGQWLALLNADAFPEPDWLECLLDAAKKYPNACFASRQVQANTPSLLDGEGDVYHMSGLAWRRNYGYPVQEKTEIEEIFSPCAAAALYPRQAFLDAGGFDEDYFSYQEDIDLGFRLRLNGLRSFYVPQAVVHHVGSASTGKHSDFAIYYGHRNLEWTYLKNMPTLLFWIFLPVHFLLIGLTFFKFVLTGHGKAIWRAKLDAVRQLPLMWRKRKEIQRNRKASSAQLYRVMERSLLAPLRVSIQRRRYGKS